MAEQRPDPIVSLGIIADVQYADHDNRYNYSQTQIRYYRKAVTFLDRAVKYWKNNNVNAILQLGDLIDGRSKPLNQSKQALQTIMEVIRLFPGEVLNCLGNHEFYNFSRTELLTLPLNTRSEVMDADDGVDSDTAKFYYATDVGPIRVISLDPYEFSMLGHDTCSRIYQEAEMFLRARNPNIDLNDPSSLEGLDRRFTKFNGGMSEAQLQWLEQELIKAKGAKQNVFILCHVPTFPSACDPLCLVWNYQDLLSVIHRHSDCVVCYMAGHDHEGGDSMDPHGIQHITWPGVVECEKEDAFATAYVYSDCVVVQGTGMYKSYDLKLRYKL